MMNNYEESTINFWIWWVRILLRRARSCTRYNTVIKFVSVLRQVGGFLRVLRFCIVTNLAISLKFWACKN